MRIRSKEEVLKEYKNKYKELDNYFISHLSEEYDKYYKIVKDLQTKDEILEVFEKEIEKNDKMYNEHAGIEGVEKALNDQYMTVLASYGLIVFFRDNMIEW